jgi:subtilisin family serine protease
MLRRHHVLALFASFALAACSPDVVGPAKTPGSVRLAIAASDRGDYLVLLKGNGIPKDFAASVAKLGGTLTTAHARAGFAIVSGLTSTAASQLASSTNVSDVMRDSEVTLDAPAGKMEADAAALLAAPSIESQTNPATAVLGSWQWNMKQIGADKLWSLKTPILGSSEVTVAILDTGIDYDNRDFFNAQSNVRLVDQTRSASFVPSDTTFRHELFPAYLANRQDPKNLSDLNGHGTNVASQVSSLAFAFAGVTSRTTLLAVKVLGAHGSGSLGAVLNGVLWAADHGADVANMSLGSSFAKNDCRDPEETTGPKGCGYAIGRFINRTFNYAHQKGMLIVVSAGNAEGNNPPTDIQHNGNEYVSYCDAPHVVCVAAVGPVVAGGNGDIPAFYSFYGESKISVSAPGGNAGTVVSAWPWGAGTASGVWSFCSRQKLAFDKDGKLVFGTDGNPFGCRGGGTVSGFLGTSQASPHVSGLAALLVAKYGKGQPDVIKDLLEQSAVPFNSAYGHGRISVTNALGL